MRYSEYFNLPKGHSNFDFVDANTDADTELFIDPCLIETNKSGFCEEAKHIMQDFFDSFLALYTQHKPVQQKLALFDHLHEVNCSKLGYGNGNNGKAKTANGILETFKKIQHLVDANIGINHLIDLPIFIKDFAEDCLSDMLTNVLFGALSQYTEEICKKYEVSMVKSKNPHYYWNVDNHNWDIYTGYSLIINGKTILLVPKNIVRHTFYYNAEHYFRSMVLEKLKKEKTTYDKEGKPYAPAKKELREQLLKSNSDIRRLDIEYTKEAPLLLKTYHNNMSAAYHQRSLTDSDLDGWVY